METISPVNLPEHIRILRRLSNLTQYELADAITRPQAWVSAFERGLARAQPRDLAAFERVLGVDLTEFR